MIQDDQKKLNCTWGELNFQDIVATFTGMNNGFNFYTGLLDDDRFNSGFECHELETLVRTELHDYKQAYKPDNAELKKEYAQLEKNKKEFTRKLAFIARIASRKWKKLPDGRTNSEINEIAKQLLQTYPDM